MKFETINNQLCRMVEPEPLTETATFPCVVRLIQDDSPMGRYNLKLRNTALEPLVVTGIAKDIGVVTHLVPRPHFSCECYEIIGYPVADGSAEWRNYQLMQGKCVCCPGDSEYYQASGQGRIIGRLIENNEFNSTWNSNTFMRDDSDGWQLYEPQPEPEPALKVGDWVEYDIDSYLRVIETPGRERTLCKTLSGVIVYPYTSCLTKVSPSEVRVKVVLEGTVSQDSILDKASCFSLHTDRSEHIISLSEIEDSELVESLLKAQEVNNG